MSEHTDATEWHTRTETPDDVSPVREVTLAAFPTAEEADILDGLRRDPAWIDGLSIVATDTAGRIVGHGVATRGYVDDAPVLGVGPVSVLPEFQNRGAGSAINRALLRAAREMGEAHVVVLGHSDYYPRFGFQPASIHGISLPFDVPDDAFMALTLDADRPLPTGVMHYAAPFGV
ncbi:GNAT family N-acetyltransferase [Gordonia aichiensis]|uniref:Putative acetyltransferase n=1 Tax=Gordonia aichiensis NBRC 108223 TaxID=1220583 RepID=L7KMW9_9ACTN|nr:N-acetyltransferase [Gordonia aichiensis]GAC50220.1 putative acetyltransferase [Gordonia aichiensis NBRC 108223]